jgi:hypothetical protein
MEKENNTGLNSEEKITRKEAILKAGKYAAFTAAAMMLVINPVESNKPPKKSPNKPRH